MSHQPACPAHNAPELSYISWHADAARRGRERQIQYLCLKCSRWQWGEHFTDKAAMGPNHFQANKISRAQAKQQREDETIENDDERQADADFGTAMGLDR